MAAVAVACTDAATTAANARVADLSARMDALERHLKREVRNGEKARNALAILKKEMRERLAALEKE
jgi:signal transduction protein with GAF and PtsI domain